MIYSRLQNTISNDRMNLAFWYLFGISKKKIVKCLLTIRKYLNQRQVHSNVGVNSVEKWNYIQGVKPNAVEIIIWPV